MATLASINGRGVVASRPAAGIAGQFYYSTDVAGGTLQRDNGSSWDSVEGGTLVRISDQTLIATASGFTSVTVPAGFTSLRLMVQAQGSINDYLKLQFNADTGTNYNTQKVYGINAGAGGAQTTAQTSVILGTAGLSPHQATIAVECFNYAGTTLYKAVIATAQDGTAVTNAAMAGVFTGEWQNTAAITAALVTVTSGLLQIGSRLTVWGVV